MSTTYAAPSETTTAPSNTSNAAKPRYSVNGDKNSYTVRVELPGVKREGLEVRLDQSVLAVNAKREPGVNSGWKTLHRELSDRSYGLRLKLNVPVEEDKMVARLEDGVLTLTLPVKEAAKPRRITVQ